MLLKVKGDEIKYFEHSFIGRYDLTSDWFILSNHSIRNFVS